MAMRVATAAEATTVVRRVAARVAVAAGVAGKVASLGAALAAETAGALSAEVRVALVAVKAMAALRAATRAEARAEAMEGTVTTVGWAAMEGPLVALDRMVGVAAQTAALQYWGSTSSLGRDWPIS